MKSKQAYYAGMILMFGSILLMSILLGFFAAASIGLFGISLLCFVASDMMRLNEALSMKRDGDA